MIRSWEQSPHEWDWGPYKRYPRIVALSSRLPSKGTAAEPGNRLLSDTKSNRSFSLLFPDVRNEYLLFKSLGLLFWSNSNEQRDFVAWICVFNSLFQLWLCFSLLLTLIICEHCQRSLFVSLPLPATASWSISVFHHLFYSTLFSFFCKWQ